MVVVWKERHKYMKERIEEVKNSELYSLQIKAQSNEVANAIEEGQSIEDIEEMYHALQGLMINEIIRDAMSV